jgi:hypothetical protein
MKTPNIKVFYCYCDAGNNKQNGSFVFTNTSGKSIQEVEIGLSARLIEGSWFVASEWGLPDLHFKKYEHDEDLDHDWHELVCVEETDENGRWDIAELLNKI